MANRFTVARKDGAIEKMKTGKTPGIVALDAGDGFIVEVGGGGGFWSPLERDPQRVLADVRSGYVSVEAAQIEYGVVIRQSGRRFELDAAATEDLRHGRRAAEEMDAKNTKGAPPPSSSPAIRLCRNPT